MGFLDRVDIVNICIFCNSRIDNIVCTIGEPAFKPMGQGPFGKHWAPLTRVAMTPAEMFANAKDILQPEPGVKLK